MAKKLKKAETKQRVTERKPLFGDLHPEVKNIILATAAFLFAILFVLSYIGKGGSIGGFLFQLLDGLLGRGYFFAPLALLIAGFSLISSKKQEVVGMVAIGVSLFLISTLSGIEVLFGDHTGGLVGYMLGSALLKLFDFWASVIIILGLLGISLLLIINQPFWKREASDEDEDDIEETEAILEGTPTTSPIHIQNDQALSAAAPIAASVDTATNSAIDMAKEEAVFPIKKIAKSFGYKKPPLDLLSGDKGTPSSGDIRANANIIKRTLDNFGISVEMGEVSIGPTVTQYTLRPAEGVKLSRITALHNDLSLALAAHPIRIEAPIPGKPLIGIEVPNKSIALVGLRALIEQKVFQDSGQPLLTALGRDVTGTPVFADLAKMPHLLISGATGSGKSVCIHTLISSFLYRNPPEVVRFIIVDPKRVELSVYNDIPHLLTPIITDPKKTIQALRWAAKEMDRRYDLLSQVHTRDIASYNLTVSKSEDKEILPYIVIVIDELADLMMTYPREVEASIIRLAQMARAVGIHLIIATQRPSVEVITGLIKANIPTRLAFQVASQIDSRTILDTAGAEKLLGNGDMLLSTADKLRRIQGAFVSEQEVKRMVDFLREETDAPEYDEKIVEVKMDDDTGEMDLSDDDDPLYEEAKDLVLQAGKASASYLQRRLRVGYARAARLLDMMEGKGVIGPADGAKPRDVLIHTAESDEASL